MLKNKLVKDFDEKHNEIKGLHKMLSKYKADSNLALDAVINCRVVVDKIMNMYNAEMVELQSCEKDLKYHKAKYENETWKLKSILDPGTLLETAFKIVENIPSGILAEMRSTYKLVKDYDKKSKKEKKELEKEGYVPPFDPTTLYTKYMFDVVHILLRTSQVPVCKHTSIEIFDADFQKYLKSDFVESIYDKLMENGWNLLHMETGYGDGTLNSKPSSIRTPADSEDDKKDPADVVSQQTMKHRQAVGLPANVTRTINQEKFLSSLQGPDKAQPDSTQRIRQDWTMQLKWIFQEFSKPYRYAVASFQAFQAKQDVARLQFDLKHHIEKRKYLKKVPEMKQDVDKHRKRYVKLAARMQNLDGISHYAIDDETLELVQPYLDLLCMIQEQDPGIQYTEFNLADVGSWQIEISQDNDNETSDEGAQSSSDESESTNQLQETTLCHNKNTVDVGQVLFSLVCDYILKYESTLEKYKATIESIKKYRIQYEKVYINHALQLEKFKKVKEKHRKAHLRLAQDLWLYTNLLKKIANQKKTIKKRGTYAIVLRPVDGPDLLRRRGLAFCKYDNLIKSEKLQFRKFKSEMKTRNKFLSEIIKRHNICKSELKKAHNPHTWYGKNGQDPWVDDKTHFEWYVKGQRCRARLKGWTKFFVGTIESTVVAPHRRRATCTIQFDDRDIAFGVNHSEIQLLYPHKVSTERAMEDGENKYFLTTFIHAHEFPSSCAPAQLARMDHMLPLMLHAMQRQHALLEDSIQAYLIVEAKLRGSASKIIQFAFRRFVFRKKLRRSIQSLLTFQFRVRKSKIRYKFLKHREKVRIFCETFIPRQHASLNIQRVFRGFMGRKSFAQKKEEARLAEVERQRKLEARRVEIEFAKRMRAKKKQAEFVANWRCPRCPIKVQYTQKFKSMAEIELHKMKHMSEDELKFSKHKAEVEAREMKRRQRLMEIKLKQEKMMIKLKKQTAEFVRQQEIQAKAKAKKRFEEKVKFLNTRFTLKYQRSILSAVKRKNQGVPVIYEQSLEELHARFLDPPYPTLRLVQDPRRPNSKSIYKGLMHRIDVNASPFRIGRGSQCDVRMDSRVNSGLISKVHCAFFASFNRKLQVREIHIADLHSTNGTFLNGERVTPGYDNRVIISDGDLVTFGAIKLEHGLRQIGKHGIIPSELIYQFCCDSGWGGDAELWKSLYSSQSS